MKVCFISVLFLLVVLASSRSFANGNRATVVYDDRATDVETTHSDHSNAELWLRLSDLKRANGFEVKPQGVCREELCFPLPKARMQEFLRADPQAKDAKTSSWFNLTAFAGLVHQPVAHDEAVSMWYFGLRSDQQQRLASLRAPDFTLPDMGGKMHSLSDFRGKKVFLITWASW